MVPCTFYVGDKVMRIMDKRKPLEEGKFAKNLEGSYIIKAVVRPMTNKLETTLGRLVPNMWNVELLKKKLPIEMEWESK